MFHLFYLGIVQLNLSNFVFPFDLDFIELICLILTPFASSFADETSMLITDPVTRLARIATPEEKA